MKRLPLHKIKTFTEFQVCIAGLKHDLLFGDFSFSFRLLEYQKGHHNGKGLSHLKVFCLSFAGACHCFNCVLGPLENLT